MNIYLMYLMKSDIYLKNIYLIYLMKSDIYLIKAEIDNNNTPRRHPAEWNAFGNASAPVPTIKLNINI